MQLYFKGLITLLVSIFAKKCQDDLPIFLNFNLVRFKKKDAI